MSLSFYKHRTNWHSHPTISKLLCYIGRCDYEAINCKQDPNDPNHWWVRLQCFYCGKEKESGFTIHPEGYR